MGGGSAAPLEETDAKRNISKQKILERFRGLPRTEQARSKTLAAQRLQSNLIPVGHYHFFLPSFALGRTTEMPLHYAFLFNSHAFPPFTPTFHR